MVDSLVTYGALSLSLGATLYAVFYIPPPPKGQRAAAASLIEPDNFTWALMGGISCLPLLNSMAWVLGALQAEAPRPYYWAAALYALPLLRNGLDQDVFSTCLLLLGVAHMQALRIGATEPELQAVLQQRLKPLSVISSLTSAAGSTVRAAVGSSSSSDLQQAGSSPLLGPAEERLQLDARSADSGEVLRRLELEDFDRRLGSSPAAAAAAAAEVPGGPDSGPVAGGSSKVRRQRQAEPDGADW